MVDYGSPLLNSLFAQDDMVNAGMEGLHTKENFLGGATLADRNGNVVAETMPHAAGGETVMLGNGETGYLVENMYGSTTFDLPGVSNDIVGRESIFESETFTQGGQYIGTLQPNSFGTGYDFTGSTGETLFSTSTNVWGNTQVDFNSFSSPLFDTSSVGQPFDVANSFSEVDTISSQFSAADLGTSLDGLDGLDMLGIF